MKRQRKGENAVKSGGRFEAVNKHAALDCQTKKKRRKLTTDDDDNNERAVVNDFQYPIVDRFDIHTAVRQSTHARPSPMHGRPPSRPRPLFPPRVEGIPLADGAADRDGQRWTRREDM